MIKLTYKKTPFGTNGIWRFGHFYHKRMEVLQKSVTLARENLRGLRELFLQKNLALFTIHQFANSQSFRDHPGFKDLCVCDTVYVWCQGILEKVLQTMIFISNKRSHHMFSQILNPRIVLRKLQSVLFFFVYFDLKKMLEKNPSFRIRENK